jgi:hypothetical protein
MKTGLEVGQLLGELRRIEEAKKDFVASTADMRMGPGKNHLFLRNTGGFPVNRLAHAQIASRVGIPKPYYDRMRESDPRLLAENVNHWLISDPKNRMVRTLDGNVRAFLSSRYRRLDYYDCARATLPILAEKGCKIVSCDVTDYKLYIKALCPTLEAEIPKIGDTIRAGVSIRDSEVGLGAVDVDPWARILSCTNGMSVPKQGLKKYHIGRDQMSGNNVQELLSDATKEQEDKAFWMMVQDVTRGFLSEEVFASVVDQINGAAEDEFKAKRLQKVVELTKTRFTLDQEESEKVIQHLIDGKELNRWALVNAVTTLANDEPSYDRASELEVIGGQILTLPKTDWLHMVSAN